MSCSHLPLSPLSHQPAACRLQAAGERTSICIYPPTWQVNGPDPQRELTRIIGPQPEGRYSLATDISRSTDLIPCHNDDDDGDGLDLVVARAVRLIVMIMCKGLSSIYPPLCQLSAYTQPRDRGFAAAPGSRKDTCSKERREKNVVSQASRSRGRHTPYPSAPCSFEYIAWLAALSRKMATYMNQATSPLSKYSTASCLDSSRRARV